MVIELPDLLPYPSIEKYTTLSELSNKLVYIFKHYPQNGVAFIPVISSGQVCIRLSDWSGKLLDPAVKSDIVEKIMVEYSRKIISTMKVIGVPKAIFYFSNDNGPRLVDMRLNQVKFCGPGYLKDFFGKQNIPIQEQVGEPVYLKSDIIEKILSGAEPYTNGRYIIKPSAFKVNVKDENVSPLYGIIENEVKNVKGMC